MAIVVTPDQAAVLRALKGWHRGMLVTDWNEGEHLKRFARVPAPHLYAMLFGIVREPMQELNELVKIGFIEESSKGEPESTWLEEMGFDRADGNKVSIGYDSSVEWERTTERGAVVVRINEDDRYTHFGVDCTHYSLTLNGYEALSAKDSKEIAFTPTASDLERIPSFSETDGNWIRAKRAAKLDGVELNTLRTYRSKGQIADDKMSGIDKDGRMWRKAGAATKHPWYYRPSLMSKK